ncbi:MAG: archaetidylserine decarboxylase [Candidatus Hamiltonella defensa (Ceratovacuna japonica)]
MDFMLKKLKIKLQYLLPQHALTRLAGWAANKKAGWLTQQVIKIFASYYRVNMKEAQYTEFSAYSSFNEFFIRSLRSDVRPIAAGDSILVQPADGTISESGRIDKDKILQAKGHDYSLEALLAGQSLLAKEFENGQFVTTYLAPGDYHRVHMPCDGVLREMIYVPGSLFSVNAFFAENVPYLFARNERVICIFNTAFGAMAQILVGAMIVGSIETLWSGPVDSERKGIIQRWVYPDEGSEAPIILKKGEEMGLFKLGSTVINLFVSNKIKLASHLQNGSITRLGEILGEAPH